MTGIMPLSRELGSYLGREPIAELVPIRGPQRPYPGHYSPEAQAEMREIYDAPDPCPPPARKAA